MPRTKENGKKMSNCTLWKRNTSLDHPIGKSTKTIDKRRKRKKKASKFIETLAKVTQEAKSENQSELSTDAISDAIVVEGPNERSSSSPKITNGTVIATSLMNGTLENNSTSGKNASALFHSLCYNEDVLSSLPNRTWAIHSTETPEKRIIVSAMMMHNSHGSGLVPHYVKQIIFDEKLNFDILLVNSRIVLKDKPTTISTIHDFEDLLDYVDGIKICAGGPPISEYSRVNPECAYRDSMNNWRHNLCSLEINCGDVCESCSSLEEILRRHAQRNRTMIKSAGKRKR